MPQNTTRRREGRRAAHPRWGSAKLRMRPWWNRRFYQLTHEIADVCAMPDTNDGSMHVTVKWAHGGYTDAVLTFEGLTALYVGARAPAEPGRLSSE